MREFKLNEHYAVVCEYQNTRKGFKHVATLLQDGSQVDKTKCLYEGRSWERFTYESVLVKLITKHFTGAERDGFMATVNSRAY